MTRQPTAATPASARPARLPNGRIQVELVGYLGGTATAVKVAHADFLDLARTRQLAVVANDVLSTAMQYLTERQLGGQPVFDRRGAPVDAAPLVAAELAVWGLQHAVTPIPRSKV